MYRTFMSIGKSIIMPHNTCRKLEYYVVLFFFVHTYISRYVCALTWNFFIAVFFLHIMLCSWLYQIKIATHTMHHYTRYNHIFLYFGLFLSNGCGHHVRMKGLTSQKEWAWEKCTKTKIRLKNFANNSYIHSSKIRGLCSMKWPSELLQNLPYFIYTKTQSVPFFISCNFVFSLMNAMVYVNVDHGIK